MPKKRFNREDKMLVYEIGLSQKALSVFHVLHDMRHYEYDTCNPSYETLRKRTGIKSNATISAAIKELEAAKILSHKNNWRKNSKKKTANYYHILTLR